MTNIAIIPARGGSRRIPRKNIKLFHGKPILAYSIETAYDSGLFREVYVSTDDDEIETVARRYCAGIIRRPVNLAQDHVGTQEVMAHALSVFPDPEDRYACCIYATAPMMTVADLCYGYAGLRESGLPYLYSAIADNGYHDAGQWYWGTVAAFRAGVSLDEGGRSVIPAHRVCDINTPEDWARAEEMYECLLVSQRNQLRV